MLETSPRAVTVVPGSRRGLARMAGALAIVAVIAACSSAAAPASTATPAPTAAPVSPGTQPPTATSTPAATDAAAATQPASPAGSGAPVTMPAGTPMLVDPFTSAGIATTVDTAAHAVDPSTYRTTIPGTQYSVVYVVFALKPDAIGKVTMRMTLDGIEVADPLTIDYGTANSWGDFKITFPSGGIPTGVYKATMTYEPTGAQVTQFFAVE
jgi:hypothetical protein